MEEKILLSQFDLHLLQRDESMILVKAKFGPSKPTRIPLSISEKLAFFAAAIIGDGHLKKEKLQIVIELNDLILIKALKRYCAELFHRDFNFGEIWNKGVLRYRLSMDSKAVYNLLHLFFEIPSGKKSDIVFVPTVIKNSGTQVKGAFLMGILITDGGRRGMGFGLSTASNLLWKDLIELFLDFDIRVKKDTWVHKKYGRRYYGFSFAKQKLLNITSLCEDKGLCDLLLAMPKFQF